MRRLRVAIGAVAGVTGGPATYAVELVRALAHLAACPQGEEGARAGGAGGGTLELTVLTDRPDRFASLDGVRCVELPLHSSWWQPWWDNVAVPRALRRLAVDVYHGTKHALPLVGLPGAVASVVTIHDLAVYAEPETFSVAQRLQLRVHLRHAARCADRVICDSSHTAHEVAAGLGVDRRRISVVPLGVSEAFRPIADPARRAAVRSEYGAGSGFLVSFVGTAQPRKRIEVAIEAVARLRAQGLDATLVVAGRRRPGFAPAWLAAPPSFVRTVGEVPETALVELYGASDAMVSPSSFEGFGLTFAEAMACGCPVVGVDATSVPEVVGEGGILVARPDAALVAEALGRLLSDPELRARTAGAALARAAGLTWEACARRTLEAYVAAAGLGEPSAGGAEVRPRRLAAEVGR